MALLRFIPENTTKGPNKKQPAEPPSTSKRSSHRSKHKPKTTSSSSQQHASGSSSSPSSSWDHFKNLLSCKQVEGSKIHDPSSKPSTTANIIGSSCGSICSFRDVVHGNTRVVHRADNSPEGSTVGQDTALLSRNRGAAGTGHGRSNGASGGHSTAPSSRAMQFRKLSGCYECRMIVDPSRYPAPRSTVSVCSQCGEVFPKVESLEHHQAVRHAVSELGPEDSGRNIVEIIFKSSWLKKDNPICVIDRILKVHNTQRTIQRFEDCRDAVKTRALTSARKNARCAADGNELLRFHCTTLSCTLGAGGSSSLCTSVPGCGVCSVIRYGGKAAVTVAADQGGFKGVRTTASSGRAHDSLKNGDQRRAMLVCRVIAGRVRRASTAETPGVDQDEGGGPVAGHFDSVASQVGGYSNLEELTVFNPKAILPCFVVIYRS